MAVGVGGSPLMLLYLQLVIRISFPSFLLRIGVTDSVDVVLVLGF